MRANAHTFPGGLTRLLGSPQQEAARKMTQCQSDEQIQIDVQAAAHACAVLRRAFTSPPSEDNVREVFDRAVIWEVAHMLWLGVTQTLITAFEGAAADVHQALGPGRVRTLGESWLLPDC